MSSFKRFEQTRLPAIIAAPKLRFAAIPATAILSALLSWGCGPTADKVPSVPVGPPPGIVVDHSPASSGIYLGSPGIAILPDGSYLAKADEFGPGSTQDQSGVTRVYRSTNRGLTWSREQDIPDLFWASLFVHRNAVYLMGTTRQNGHTVILRSDDGGRGWSRPTDESSGLLFSDGSYHCAPVPVVTHSGRLWRAMEDTMGPDGWGSHFRAFMMSVPVESDLLNASNWTSSNRVGRNPEWLGGKFGGWLEGNAVVTPAGGVANILRVDYRPEGAKAAMTDISEDGTTAAFDPETGFVDFPGGCKKFTIRFDSQTELYWSLTNYVPPAQRNENPERTRNTVALVSSADLRTWKIRSIILHHPDRGRHGFQYLDWLFEGDDMIALSRTAFDDPEGGAHNQHDANYVTFHRIRRFRELSLADSTVPPEELGMTTAVRSQK